VQSQCQNPTIVAGSWHCLPKILPGETKHIEMAEEKIKDMIRNAEFFLTIDEYGDFYCHSAANPEC
jgi:hypothetical protein